MALAALIQIYGGHAQWGVALQSGNALLFPSHDRVPLGRDANVPDCMLLGSALG